MMRMSNCTHEDSETSFPKLLELHVSFLRIRYKRQLQDLAATEERQLSCHPFGRNGAKP